jgi:RNA polymerase sigma factor (sigma-70 family)
LSWADSVRAVPRRWFPTRSRRGVGLSRTPVSTRLGVALTLLRPENDSPKASEPAAGAPRQSEELLSAIALGRDRAAFAALFVSYAPRLKGHLLARGVDGATAEEIIQEVMLAVWRKADQFDAGRGSAATWLFALTRNAFIDRVRRESRPEVDAADPLLMDDTTAPGAERLVLEAETERDLAHAVDALPAEQQLVVRRSYFHGQSLSEIAVEEGLPLGTVKTRARLALAHLRSLVTRRRDS